MKTLILGLLLTTSSFATTLVRPDITCLERTGFTYNFYFKNFSEIHSFDERGEEIGHYDGLSVEIKHLKREPILTVYTFSYDDGVEIAEIEFIEGQDFGEGEMTDHDSKMVCPRSL